MGAARPQHNHCELPVETLGQPRTRESVVEYINLRSKLPADYYSLRTTYGQSPFSEAEEMELAVELLEVTTEAELEQFLGNLFKKAWRGIKAIGSSVTRPLGGVLKTVAKTALPFVATAAGTFFGGPAGGAIAGKLGSLVSQALEAEAAGMNAADRDLEKCRQFVRMAGKAARAAALTPAGTNPIAVAQKVLADSAQEKRTKPPPITRRTGRGAKTEAAPSPLISIPARTMQTGRRRAESGIAVANERPCSRCGQPYSICKCTTINRTGRWMRHGRSIVIVNC
jgi:hypothetical protein